MKEEDNKKEEKEEEEKKELKDGNVDDIKGEEDKFRKR